MVVMKVIVLMVSVLCTEGLFGAAAGSEALVAAASPLGGIALQGLGSAASRSRTPIQRTQSDSRVELGEVSVASDSSGDGEAGSVAISNPVSRRSSASGIFLEDGQGRTVGPVRFSLLPSQSKAAQAAALAGLRAHQEECEKQGDEARMEVNKELLELAGQLEELLRNDPIEANAANDVERALREEFEQMNLKSVDDVLGGALLEEPANKQDFGQAVEILMLRKQTEKKMTSRTIAKLKKELRELSEKIRIKNNIIQSLTEDNRWFRERVEQYKQYTADLERYINDLVPRVEKAIAQKIVMIKTLQEREDSALRALLKLQSGE